jgi:hypothetical protein
MDQAPANKLPSVAESCWWKWCSQFIANHKPVVTILSALTVLTGFVVKDTLDEPAKDLLASIKVAERDNNQDQSGLYTQLANINENLTIVKDKLIGGQTPDHADLQMRKLQTDRAKTFVLLGENYSHLVALEPALPTSFEKQKADFDAKYQTLQAADAAALRGSSSTDEASVNEALANSLSKWQALYYQSTLVRGEGVKQLIERKDRTEVLHQIYEWIAYVAFGLGWIVGLISNLVEGKLAPAGE